MISEEKLAALRVEYDGILPLATRFEREGLHLLNELVSSKDLPLAFPVQSRVKEWGSIADKLRRLPLNIRTITDLDDIVGFRAILLFQRDAEHLSRLLSSTFTVIKHLDTRTRLKEDQFGYSSTHLIVRVPDVWLAVPTWEGLAPIKAEIQVRTLAQHIWAATSHALQYKRDASVPSQAKRSIYRLSALLEGIDNELERILDQRTTAAQPGAFPSRLDIPSLEALLTSLLPPDNRDADEDYDTLLAQLRAVGFDSPERMHELVEKHLDASLAEDRQEVAKRSSALDLEEPSERRRITELGVFFTHTGLVRMALDLELGPEWREGIDPVV